MDSIVEGTLKLSILLRLRGVRKKILLVSVGHWAPILGLKGLVFFPLFGPIPFHMICPEVIVSSVPVLG